MRTFIWRPDTCECVFEKGWDETIPADQRVETLLSAQAKCDLHGILDDATAHDMVLSENMKKNQAVGLVVETYPDISPSDISWEFGDNREVVLSCDQLTPDQLTTLQPQLDETFSVSEVKVV